MEDIDRLEIDFDKEILRVNGDIITYPIVVELPDPSGWNKAKLFNAEKAVISQGMDTLAVEVKSGTVKMPPIDGYYRTGRKVRRMEDKKLKSICIDLENNIFELNGEDIRNASKVEIGYSNGTWTVLTERTYSFTGRLLCPDKERSNQDAFRGGKGRRIKDMFIRTKDFMGELNKIKYFVKVGEVDEFYLHAKTEDGFEIVTKKKTEQELDDFMEALTDAVENGQEVFRE